MLVPQPKQASLSEERVELPFPASQYLTVRCQSEFLFASQTRDLIEKELNRDGEAKSAGQNCLVLLSAPSSEDEKDFFSKCENAAEAYILRLKKASIELIATKHAGFINAAMSARQLLCWKNDTLSFPLGELHDWPDFGVRAAARWTLCGEATRWALDYGEGPEAFLEFAQKELDFLMRHKVNAVYFDGFTLDAERFPGYARLVSSLNDYAALRNIRLVFGFTALALAAMEPTICSLKHIISCPEPELISTASIIPTAKSMPAAAIIRRALKPVLTAPAARTQAWQLANVK